VFVELVPTIIFPTLAGSAIPSHESRLSQLLILRGQPFKGHLELLELRLIRR
jgi:hypothetical protein